MPECEAFPETAGPYELEDCEAGPDGNATHVSYAALDEGEVFYMDATNLGYELDAPGMDQWSISCHAWDPDDDASWECTFGDASYEAFSSDEITGEMRMLGRSIDEELFDEMRNDRW